MKPLSCPGRGFVFALVLVGYEQKPPACHIPEPALRTFPLLPALTPFFLFPQVFAGGKSSLFWQFSMFFFFFFSFLSGHRPLRRGFWSPLLQVFFFSTFFLS